MTTRFMLARHASCALTDQLLFGSAIDAPLDATGARAAQSLGRRLAREKPSLVLTSPRRSARETAHIVVAEALCPLQLAPALDDVDFGAWSGQSFATLARDAHWRRWGSERATCRTPAGDSMLAVQTRIVEFLHALAFSHPGETLVMVSHAEPIRAALLRALRVSLDYWQRIEIDTASLSTLRLTPGGLRVESLNEQVAPDGAGDAASALRRAHVDARARRTQHAERAPRARRDAAAQNKPPC